MFGDRKLKGPISRLGFVVPVIFVALSILETMILGKPLYSALAFGAFLVVLGIAEYVRTRLLVYLVLGLIFGTNTWHSLAPFIGAPLSGKTYFAHLLVSLLALLLAWPVVSRNERLDQSARRLFRLAADQVHEAANGFTPRPYATRAVECSREDVVGLARLLNAQYVVKPRYEGDGVLLMFSMGISPLKDPDPGLISYVSIGFDGAISVHIAQSDYGLYKEHLTFDRICASMAEVFTRFLEYYRKGLDGRIGSELKSGSLEA